MIDHHRGPVTPKLVFESWGEFRERHRKRFPKSYERGAPLWHRIVRAWYDEQSETVFVWRGARWFPDYQRVLAHEWGHHDETSGLLHPEKGDWRRYLDVRGIGLRITDELNLMRRSRPWRRSVLR